MYNLDKNFLCKNFVLHKSNIRAYMRLYVTSKSQRSPMGNDGKVKNFQLCVPPPRSACAESPSNIIIAHLCRHPESVY